MNQESLNAVGEIVIAGLIVAMLFVALRMDHRMRHPPRVPWDPKEGDRVRLKENIDVLVVSTVVVLEQGRTGTVRLRSLGDEIVYYVRFDNGPTAVPFTTEELCSLEPL